MKSSKHTGDSYAGKAAAYAKSNENKPIQRFYARPAIIDLMPSDIEGKHVLDVGCGGGWFTEYLLTKGATVTAFDYEEVFVDLTAARVSHRARVLQADLSQPLSFAQDNSFDLIIAPLVIHYIKDWAGPLGEFQRILKKRGILLFTTHHPFNDWVLFEREDYFATEQIDDEWDIGPVSFYRRPLTSMCEALNQAGLQIEQIVEPRPRPDYREIDPEWYERLNKNPWFIGFRAAKRC